MARSYMAESPGALARSSTAPQRVLVTGAAGYIGSYFAEHAAAHHDLRLGETVGARSLSDGGQQSGLPEELGPPRQGCHPSEQAPPGAPGHCLLPSTSTATSLSVIRRSTTVCSPNR
ncbi:MAG: NAD(P)-dependent oxidoreductase [Chthonomonadales bacterium]|nr:NAD(P)-dependent oxidoreductase [Chthonomonadales bacterium]